MARQRLKIEDINLGEEFKDIITGFEGIATSTHYYINGCHQVGLSRQRGDEPKVMSFDVERIERIGEGVAADFRPEDLSEPGGPGDHAAARGPSRS